MNRVLPHWVSLAVYTVAVVIVTAFVTALIVWPISAKRTAIEVSETRSNVVVLDGSSARITDVTRAGDLG